MITASIERHRPVVIPTYLIPSLMSGRLRALVRPVDTIGAVRPGYGLWVREAITVAERQRRRDMLDLTYAGESRRASVAWMPAVSKPGPGRREADGMPVQASRLTLLVERVDYMRLAQVDEDAAVAAGVEPEFERYSALGFPFMRPFETHSEALGFILDQQRLLEENNPEVAVIHFKAVARNIGLLVRYAG